MQLSMRDGVSIRLRRSFGEDKVQSDEFGLRSLLARAGDVINKKCDWNRFRCLDCVDVREMDPAPERIAPMASIAARCKFSFSVRRPVTWKNRRDERQRFSHSDQCEARSEGIT